MKLLLLHTCGAEGSLALADTSLDEPLRVVTMPSRSAAQLLVRLLRETMAEVGWTLKDIAAIAVVTGPGSFTGVRVGLSAAKGLSEGACVPLIAVSRLELLASLAARDGSRTVCALLDAGRGEIYCGRFREGEPLGESLLSLEAAVAAGGAADEVVVCEDAVERGLAGMLAVTRVPEPSASEALPFAIKRATQGAFEDAATLDANYLRRTDAEIFASSPKRSAG